MSGVLEKLLVTGRKLKPVVKKRSPVVCEGISSAKIYVHVIKGENVPVRLDYIE